MIISQQIRVMRGGRTLLQEASFRIHAGEKVGVVGKNGCGKSSLFSALLGEFELESGELTIPQQWRVATVRQHVTDTCRSVLDYIIDGDSEFRRIQACLRRAEHDDDGLAIAQLHAQLDTMNAYNIEARAASLATGLGFQHQQLQQPLHVFSGGWQSRANLAQALMAPSELLLLDEPTNHLDLDAVMWLERWLDQYSGTVLLISHDRDFLDGVVGRVLFFQDQHITTYTGNYSQCEIQRVQKCTQQQALAEKQQSRRAHLTRFVERFRAKASKARQAQSRLKMLEKMEQVAVLQTDSPFQFQFAKPEHLPMPMLQLTDASIGYDANQPLLTQVNFELHPGMRLGLLGHNGAGKTTLMRTLAGQLQRLSGRYHANAKLKIGYFTQQQIEMLDGQASPMLHLDRLSPEITSQKKRDFLGGFGFSGDRALTEIAPFSGGEKARLALALIVWQAPNILFLDEPTNHLDLDMRDALTHALLDFLGAIVVISHDRHLLRAVCDDFFLVNQGCVQVFNDDLAGYYRWLMNTEMHSEIALKSKKQNSPSQMVKQTQLTALKNKLKQEEKKQIQLRTRLQDIEKQLYEPAMYEDTCKQELQALLDEQNTLTTQLHMSEECWLDDQHALEQLMSEE